MSKVLVTGATGFIGSFLSRQATDFRYVIRDDELQSFKDYYKIDGIHGSTCWKGAFDNISCVLHLAGLAHNKRLTDTQYKEVNYEGTIRLAREAINSGVKRFVFVSSIGVNGCSTYDSPFSVSSEPKTHNAYAQSKLDAELGLQRISDETGLEVVIIRPTLVYGKNAPGNFGSLIKIVKILPVLPFGFAENKRDFIAVQNLADLLITCATHPNAAGHTFLASDMETVSIKQFTNTIADGLGKKVLQLPIPVSLMRLAGKLIGKSAMVEQLVGNLQVDSSNAKEVLDWTPPLTMRQAMATLRDSGQSSSGKE